MFNYGHLEEQVSVVQRNLFPWGCAKSENRVQLTEILAQWNMHAVHGQDCLTVLTILFVTFYCISASTRHTSTPCIGMQI